MPKSKKFWFVIFAIFGLGLVGIVSHQDIEDTDMYSVEYLKISVPNVGTVHLSDGRVIKISAQDHYDELNDRFEVLYTLTVDGESVCYFEFDENDFHGGSFHMGDDIICENLYAHPEAFIMIPSVMVKDHAENTLQVEYVEYLHIPVQSRAFSIVLARGDRSKLITTRPLTVYSEQMTRVSVNGFEYCTFDTKLDLRGAWFGDSAFCPSDDGYAETMIEGSFDSLYVIGR